MLSLPSQALKAHIGATRSLWSHYPVVVQITLAERVALDALIEGITSFRNNDDATAWKASIKTFLDCFQWHNVDSVPPESEDKKTFQANAAHFTFPLDVLLRCACDLQEQNLMLSGFDGDAGEVVADKPEDPVLEAVKSGAQDRHCCGQLWLYHFGASGYSGYSATGNMRIQAISRQ